MKKILMAVIILIIAFSSCCFAADNNSVKSGILSYLGTTESEFQIALDDLRKSVAPLIPTDDSHLEEWEDYDMFEGFLSSLVKNRRIVKFYDSLLSMQMALRSSMIDEIVLPEAVVMYIVNNNPTQYEILFSLNMMPSTISFGFKKGNVELQKEFNSAISAMRKDGTLMSLEEKYINQLGASEPAKAKFQEFKGAKTIKVAVTGDLPPIDFIAADGTPTGYNTAILSESENA
ncbi:MAG: transporter substrate-binding domain-containing protein [Synergistaceae bacterium]|nr:transporter substrate-binding domain-containing protein [Synergistaceae bacterium]